MENNKTPHILSASSNLLGICFLIVTSLRVLHLTGSTYMDELATVALVLFMSSCIFSFLAIRAGNKKIAKAIRNRCRLYFSHGPRSAFPDRVVFYAEYFALILQYRNKKIER